MNDKYPPVLSDLAEQVHNRLVRLGMAAAESRRIAFEVAEHVRFHWGGQQIYISKGTSYDVSERDLQIYCKFDGQNLSELCRDYGLCEARLRTIIRTVRKELRERGQLSLFPNRDEETLAGSSD